jgi:membrane fusion protein (multidrug efflux system)
MSKSIYFFLILLLCSTILLSACTALQPTTAPTVGTPEPQNSSSMISATGVVAPLEYVNLSMSIPGVAAEVLVKRGDLVEKGQVLVRLKGKEEQQAAIENAKFEVQAAEKALADLSEAAKIAETASLDAISANEKLVRDAQYQLDNYTVPSNQKDLDPMQAVEIMKKALDDARTAFEEVKDRPAGDSTRQDRKDDLDKAQSDYDTAIRRLQLVIALEVAQSNLDKAHQDYETWKNGPKPADIVLAQARIDNAQASLAAAEASLDDLELLAPFAGTVSELNIRQGEWVTPGVPVILLADLSRLRVETTDLNEIDAARVKVGETVKVTFDALPDVVVQGTIQSIATKASPGSGVNYTAVIELAEIPEALLWGMTAFVDIAVK